MFLKPYKQYFILVNIKEAEEHEARNYWTLMKILMSTISTKIEMGISRLFYKCGFSSTGYPQTKD